jgi:3-phenylpropionate/trans-cinnamate dioxygenase alpha subunit
MNTRIAVDELVSVERGELNRRIFSDIEIFELEMEHIFGRAWLFLAHESMIPKAGDFFETRMGRDNVLVVRQKDGSIKGLLNTCTHRGNAVCRAEEGNTKNFMCTYHGWTFAITGELIGVPGFENLYHSDLDRSSLGLVEIAQLDSYKGFIFGSLDPSAPPLGEYLGPTGRLAIDLFTMPGDVEVVPGIQKFVVDCNWKFAVDNLFDFYHPAVSHMSAMSVMMARPQAGKSDEKETLDRGGAKKDDGTDVDLAQAGTGESLVVLGEYGHAIGGPTYESMRGLMTEMAQAQPWLSQDWRDSPEALDVLGPVGVRLNGYQSIFPSLWVANLNRQLCLRVPTGPTTTELWWFGLMRKEASVEERTAQLSRHIHTFGPAGMLEQEDGENWAQSTTQTHGLASRKIPQALKMDLGRGKVIREHGLARIEGVTSEHPQLWTYAAWAQYVSGVDWATIKKNTTPGDRY